MFPFVARYRKVDEHGEVVRAGEHMRAEDQAEGDLPDAANVKGNGMGKERKWTRMRAGEGALWTRKFGRDATNSGKKRHVSKSKIERPDGDGGCEPESAEMDEAEEGEVDQDGDEDGEAILAAQEAHLLNPSLAMGFRVAFIDFAGLHDSEDLRMLLHVAPISCVPKLKTGGTGRSKNSRQARKSKMAIPTIRRNFPHPSRHTACRRGRNRIQARQLMPLISALRTSAFEIKVGPPVHDIL